MAEEAQLATVGLPLTMNEEEDIEDAAAHQVPNEGLWDEGTLRRVADGVHAAAEFPSSALNALLLRNETAPHCVATTRQLCDGTNEVDWFPAYKLLHPWIANLETGMDKLWGELRAIGDDSFLPFSVRDDRVVASDAGASMMEFFPLFVLGNTMFKNTKAMRHSWRFLHELGIPGLLNVGFQQLKPGQTATASCSLRDGLLYTRVVMAVQVPESATLATTPRMQVCGGVHLFKRGHTLGFNNTFPLEVSNPGNALLRLLLIDIVQPSLLTSATYQAVVHKLADEWAPLFETMKASGVPYANTLATTLWEQADSWEAVQSDLFAKQQLIDNALLHQRHKDELR